MAGINFNTAESVLPRGLLLFHGVGTGKTRSFISSALYTISTKKDVYKNPKIIIIVNKVLIEQIKKEIVNYI